MLVLFSSNIFVLPSVISAVKKTVELTDIQLGLLVYGSNIAFYIIFLIVTYVLLGKRSLKFFFRYLLYSIYTLTWIPITIQGILRKNNKDWNPTKHVRSVEICDVKL